jgi:hypothetical protein
VTVAGPNQALHHDRGRILFSRDTTPLQRPRRVNWCVRPWRAVVTASNATTPSRANAICLHVGLVALSFVLSIGILSGVGLMRGEALDCLAIGTLVIHGAATVVALFLRRATLASCAMIFGIAFLPAGCEVIARVRQSYRMRYVLPGDRFRDHLASPVPASVSGLRFVPLEEQIRPDLMFRFDIAPDDLDALIAKLALKRVEPDSLWNPRDFFRHPHYFPLEGPYHLFQGTDRYGEVLTIKTNAEHSHAIFRKESSGFYRDRSWEGGNPTLRQMEDEALAAMKVKFEERPKAR